MEHFNKTSEEIVELFIANQTGKLNKSKANLQSFNEFKALRKLSVLWKVGNLIIFDYNLLHSLISEKFSLRHSKRRYSGIKDFLE